MKNNWPVKKLGEVVIINPPKGEVSNLPVGTAVSFVSMASINENVGTISNMQTRNLEDVKAGYTYFANNDVLFAKITPCMENGKVAIAQNLQNGIGFGTTEVHVLRPTDQILPEWVYSTVSRDQFRENAERHMTGSAGQQRVPREFLENAQIPVPPLKSQKKIVERLDAVRRAQEFCSEQIQKTEELLESIATSAFQSGAEYKLGELFLRQTKTILPTTNPDKDFNFIGLENIESNKGRLVNFKTTIGKFIKSSKFVFAKKDVLYGKLRPYLNKVWLAEFDGICSTDIWVLRANENLIKPLILATLLRSKIVVNRMSSVMTGTNLPRANAPSFDHLKVMIPNIENQEKIVEELDAVQDYKKLLQKQKSLLKELFDSILDKSMKGELDT